MQVELYITWIGFVFVFIEKDDRVIFIGLKIIEFQYFRKFSWMTHLV